jgi:cobalt/nickel transport system permease protein
MSLDGVRHPGASPTSLGLLYRVSPTVKLVGLVVFALVVVALPREWVWVYVTAWVGLVVLVLVARIPLQQVLARMVIDLPFLGFAALLPFVAEGPRIEIAGMSLAVAGLWGAWALIAKATICITAAIVVAGTTDPRRLVLALESLRVPRELTSIMSFMLRYFAVILDEAQRMRVARQARGFRARNPRSWTVLGGSVSALFIRAHARGERVHLARLSRGLGQGS